MLFHNSKYYKKSWKRNKIVSHTLEKFLKRKEDDNNLYSKSQESSFTRENTEIVTQPENDNSLEVQVEEVSTHARSVIL